MPNKSGTPWSERTPEARAKIAAHNREKRKDPKFQKERREHQRDYYNRVRVKENVMLDVARGTPTSEIMVKYNLTYEDVQRIRDGKPPRSEKMKRRVS